MKEHLAGKRHADDEDLQHAVVDKLRDEFHWDTFDHPPYSPDLAPLDFHLFLKMKEDLAGKRHADYEDLQHAVVDWLNIQAAVWYEDGTSKLVSR